jgi:uncharacterized repeat protein (TIGR03803 family)
MPASTQMEACTQMEGCTVISIPNLSNIFGPTLMWRVWRIAARSVLATLLCFVASPAAAQSAEAVMDFGDPGGRAPKGALVEASNGCLYGTTIQGGTAYGTIYRTCGADTTTVFVFNSSNGRYAEAGLIAAADGLLYGVTRYGGASDKGTIYRFDPNTSQLVTVHAFAGGSGGAEPRAELMQAADGRLYGVTAAGGSSNWGTVFTIQTSGAGFSVLRSFTGANGRIPIGRLVQANGVFFGTTSAGGANGSGTVFQIDSAGNLTTLLSFNGANGSSPNDGLLLATNGSLYGTTQGGGTSGLGTVFQMTVGGQFTLLRSFSGANGSLPSAGLIQGTDGQFYGATAYGGTAGNGVIFKMDSAGNISVLRSMVTADGTRPESALVQSSNGRFYGTAPVSGPAGASGTLFEITSSGAFARLHAFTGTPAAPQGALLLGMDGQLYGNSWRGGSANNGTLFRLRPGISSDLLYEFSGVTDGKNLYDGLTQAADGTIYGTAVNGGTSNRGSIFKQVPNGVFAPILSLTETNNNGFFPYSAPVQTITGNLYGVASAGGASGKGTIYKLTPTGTVTPVFAFNGTSQGSTPYGRLYLGAGGVFYGTTAVGGTAFQGTLFRFDPVTNAYSMLHSFSGPDGAVLYSGVIQGSDGRLYGMTYRGGAYGFGTVFAFDVGTGQLTTLHSFNQTNGAYPYSTLVEASDGRLYGTTRFGGSSDLGTVFQIQKTGAGFQVMHSFRGNDGANPYAGLVEMSDGYLYGTAPAGGSTNNGVIYRVPRADAPPPPPPTASVTVTAPNTAISVTVGNTLPITWIHNMGAGSVVRLDVSRDGGQTWTEISSSVVNSGATVGSYNWVTSGATTQARIRVSTTDGSVSDMSDVNFTIAAASAGSITVTAPNTAVNWGVGSTQRIKWNHTLAKGSTVRVELSRDGGVSWSEIAASVVNGGTSGSYNWVVPSPVTSSARIRVTSTDGLISDVSNTNFTIGAPFVTVTTPNLSSVVWTVGTNGSVKWSSNLGALENVKIELSTDGGITYPTVVLASTPSDGSQNVAVVSSWVSSTAKVRITWLKNSTVQDVSDQSFQIR